MGGTGFTERGEHDWSGHGAVGGDGQGVAGAVIEPGQDLYIGALLGAADAATRQPTIDVRACPRNSRTSFAIWCGRW